MQGVRRQVCLAPALERRAVDPMAGVPETGSQGHLGVQFTDEVEAVVDFRRQKGGIQGFEAGRQGRIREAVRGWIVSCWFVGCWLSVVSGPLLLSGSKSG